MAGVLAFLAFLAFSRIHQKGGSFQHRNVSVQIDTIISVHCSGGLLSFFPSSLLSGGPFSRHLEQFSYGDLLIFYVHFDPE